MDLSKILRRSLKWNDFLSAPYNAERISFLPRIMERETLAKLDQLESQILYLIAKEEK